MCRALESELVQLMQPTLQVYTRLKNKRLRELIRAAVIATRQLDGFVNGIIQKEEKTKTTYLEVERHARGGWLLRWAETNLLTDAVCIFDAEIDEQNLGQSLIDTVVQKTAHRSQRRQPKQAAAAAAATTTVLATNDEVMNVGQDMHDPVRVTNVVAAAAAATKSEKNEENRQQQMQQQQQTNDWVTASEPYFGHEYTTPPPPPPAPLPTFQPPRRPPPSPASLLRATRFLNLPPPVPANTPRRPEKTAFVLSPDRPQQDNPNQWEKVDIYVLPSGVSLSKSPPSSKKI